MQISSTDYSTLLSAYLNTINKVSNAASSATEAEETAAIGQADNATLSDETLRMPPPPHEMDFGSMTDDELKDYLAQMYAITGTLPGGMEGDVENLSAETLAEIREILTEMSASDPAAKALANENASALSGEDMNTLLSLFMYNLQSSMTLGGSSSDDDGLLFSGGDQSMMMQMVIDSILNKLASASAEETANTKVEQAAAAYQQVML